VRPGCQSAGAINVFSQIGIAILAPKPTLAGGNSYLVKTPGRVASMSVSISQRIELRSEIFGNNSKSAIS
jgi:hypothetical protein